MGLCDRTYWWISCDADGCNAGDNLDDSDDSSGAEEKARQAGFVRRDFHWYCAVHAELQA